VEETKWVFYENEEGWGKTIDREGKREGEGDEKNERTVKTFFSDEREDKNEPFGKNWGSHPRHPVWDVKRQQTTAAKERRGVHLRLWGSGGVPLGSNN